MGFRFQRRIKIMPGVTLNVGKRGVSTSIGRRGAHITFGQNGVRTTVGIPGTGISYTSLSNYSPEKNGGKKLAEQTVGTKVTTDVYRVNPNTNEILCLGKNGSMQVAEKTRNDGTTYRVLRDLK